MLCSVCNKNLATVHIQEVVGSVKNTVHICQACAVAKGLNIPGPEGLNLSEFLQNISSDNVNLSQYLAIDEDEIKTTDVFTCSKCGWDDNKMRKTGRLGCSECYHAYRDTLTHSLAAMHRGVIHCGKIPSIVAGKRNTFVANFSKLQKQLEKHIKSEEYEEAAKIRDKLKDLKFEKAER